MIAHFLRITYWIKDFFKGQPIGKHYKEIKLIQKGGAESENRREQLLS